MCNIQPLTQCGLSISGITKLWLIPFGDLYDYSYDPNNLNVITDYKALSIPVEFLCKRSNNNFNSSAEINNDNGTVIFNNSLTLQFPLMGQDKRNEFEKIIHKQLTILFKDGNGKCWIMGFDNPVKVSEFTYGTGDENIYSVTFSNTSKEQIKEVVCFDGECFTSFDGFEKRTSIFTIPDASTVNTNTLLEITGDTTLYQLSVTTPLNPVNWNNPFFNNQDANTITNLISGTSSTVTLTYDPLTDVAEVIILSDDTSFDNFRLFPTISRSLVSITLNLVLTMGNVAASSTISVVDDNTGLTLYSGQYNDPVTGSGLSGIVGNAFIVLTSGGSQQFTASVTGSPCIDSYYTYNYEPLAICNMVINTSFKKGRKYVINFDVLDLQPYFRKMSFVYDGYFCELYPDKAQWHSNGTQFINDLTGAILSLGSDIIPSSLIITYTHPKVRIEFIGNDHSASWITLYGTTFLRTNGIERYSAYRSSLLNINTVGAGTDLIINYGGMIEGPYGNTPTYLDPAISYEGGNTDNIDIDVNLNLETESYAIRQIYSACPAFTEVGVPSVCPTGRSRSLYGNYIVLYKDVIDAGVSDAVMGSTISITTNVRSLTITFPAQLTPTTGINEMCTELARSGFKVWNCFWDREAVLYIELSSGAETIGAFEFTEVSVTMDSSISGELGKYDLTPTAHPAISTEVEIDTYYGTQLLPQEPLKEIVSEVFTQVELVKRLTYASPNIIVEGGLEGNSATGNVWVRFFDAPNGTELASFIANSLYDVFDLDTELSNNGYTISNVAWVKIETYDRWEGLFVPSVTSSVDIYEKFHRQHLFGRYDEIFALVLDHTSNTITDTISSSIC